ncbi:MAG: UDP-glucose 6-dehydrogenase [Spongiibacteraceae bacterium]|nr:UDP-glucose 6-dehydrogenase [Spongiibacteraceae bacterium]
MRITVVGCGYVGLVTAACFTEMGNTVTCVDTNEARLTDLRVGRMPIYEPGLGDMVANACSDGRMKFAADLSDALDGADYIFNAVGTPPLEDGSVDLSGVYQVARTIGQSLTHYSIIVNKSTVPVGTAETVHQIIADEIAARGESVEFDVVSNPEFLKEGTAIADFMGPDRVIIGSDSERAKRRMALLYAPYLKKNDRVMFMGPREAEMTKYAANAMLATRVSFMNQIANLCDRLGVDVEDVRQGIGSDKRIGSAFLYPGCGYGGSCFPKDVQALMYAGRGVDYELSVLSEVEAINAKQKSVLFEKLHAYFNGQIASKKIAIWGLAFKPGTDDMRQAPSIALIDALIRSGASVAAFDPKANGVAREMLRGAGDSLQIMDDQYRVADDADALVLMTEWKQFRSPDFRDLKRRMSGSVIFDGRNQYDPEALGDFGFDYIGVGRTNWGARR